MTLTLKTANQSFCMTLQLMMMHNSTKFGIKILGGLEDIIWKNTDMLFLHCGLDLDCIIQFF